MSQPNDCPQCFGTDGNHTGGCRLARAVLVELGRPTAAFRISGGITNPGETHVREVAAGELLAILGRRLGLDEQVQESLAALSTELDPLPGAVGCTWPRGDDDSRPVIGAGVALVCGQCDWRGTVATAVAGGDDDGRPLRCPECRGPTELAEPTPEEISRRLMGEPPAEDTCAHGVPETEAEAHCLSCLHDDFDRALGRTDDEVSRLTERVVRLERGAKPNKARAIVEGERRGP